MATIHSESIFLPFAQGEQLHLRRFKPSVPSPAVLLIHGAIENGKIFYSDSGKGFAPWLASQGFDVFAADLRGRGLSSPKIGRHSNWGQSEALSEEYPALFDGVCAATGSNRLYVGTHSWAGVNVLAFLARHAKPYDIPALFFFGSKRHISVRPFPYYQLMIGLAWERLARRSIRKLGYLDAVRYRMGSDNLSARDWAETNAWVRDGRQWLHWEDGFDYKAALNKMQLPPTLYIAGKKDRVLGNPKDVHLLAEETGSHQRRDHLLLAKSNGFQHDYGHIDMLTHPDAPSDVFPKVLDWLRKHP